MALCIVAVIGLGHLLLGAFATIAVAEAVRVNLVVAGLICAMIVPKLLKAILARLGRCASNGRALCITLFVN